MISRITLAAIGLLLAAGEANATLVEVAFEGTVTEVTGSLPGDPSIGTSFSGTVRYDGDQPPAGFGDTVFDFADGSAALTITLAGTVYETETSAPDVVMIRQLLLVDRDDPDQPVDPSDPLAVLRADFTMPSAANVDVGAGDYDMVLSWIQFPIISDVDLLALSLPPQPSSVLAGQLEGGGLVEAGEATVSFASGGTFRGQINLAVPEPATALLLGGGLLMLGLQRSRRG
jgi:hypothetical protein